eukprot:6096044-Pleurochrysis_carterae.AAC.1
MDRAILLYSVYDEAHVFPTWVKNDFLILMQEFGSRTKVYFSNYHLQEVESLVTMREPVNIGRGMFTDGDLNYDAHT